MSKFSAGNCLAGMRKGLASNLVCQGPNISLTLGFLGIKNVHLVCQKTITNSQFYYSSDMDYPLAMECLV